MLICVLGALNLFGVFHLSETNVYSKLALESTNSGRLWPDADKLNLKVINKSHLGYKKEKP